jgi:hypothetical protein
MQLHIDFESRGENLQLILNKFDSIAWSKYLVTQV